MPKIKTCLTLRSQGGLVLPGAKKFLDPPLPEKTTMKLGMVMLTFNPRRKKQQICDFEASLIYRVTGFGTVMVQKESCLFSPQKV